jgi:hypothetical protein
MGGDDVNKNICDLTRGGVPNLTAASSEKRSSFSSKE